MENKKNPLKLTESKKKELTDRMLNAYRKRKRKEKIEKLMNRDNLWKGLE